MAWRREWQPTPAFLPGESHGQRSMVGYSPHGRKELDMTKLLTLSFLLSYIYKIFGFSPPYSFSCTIIYIDFLSYKLCVWVFFGGKRLGLFVCFCHAMLLVESRFPNQGWKMDHCQ